MVLFAQIGGNIKAAALGRSSGGSTFIYRVIPTIIHITISRRGFLFVLVEVAEVGEAVVVAAAAAAAVVVAVAAAATAAVAPAVVGAAALAAASVAALALAARTGGAAAARRGRFTAARWLAAASR